MNMECGVHGITAGSILAFDWRV